jgi:hypothetical protein
MGSGLLDEQTPLEYFRERVVVAVEHQKLEVSELAQYYLVDLLARCVRADALLSADEPGADEMPLAMLYLKALEASAAERPRLLRAMGDTALFVSGVFASSLVDRVGDLRYYRVLGGDAYARLGRERRPTATVFAELAARFQDLADVLSEVSEASRLASPLSVLRLYQRYLQTGSRRAAPLLGQLGVTPMNPGPGGRAH